MTESTAPHFEAPLPKSGPWDLIEEIPEEDSRWQEVSTLLDNEEYHQLIIKAQNGDKEALTQAWEGALPVVEYVATIYKGSLSRVDRIQAGMFRIPAALLRYNPDKYRISTYCYSYAFNGMHDEERRQDKLPRSMREAKKVLDLLSRADPNYDEKLQGIKRQFSQHTARIVKGELLEPETSLEAMIHGSTPTEDDEDTREVLVLAYEENQVDGILADDTRQAIREFVRGLPAKERFIFYCTSDVQFGFGILPPSKQVHLATAEVAELLGVSENWIYQKKRAVLQGILAHLTASGLAEARLAA